MSETDSSADGRASNSATPSSSEPMMTAARARFELPVPQPMPTVLNMQYICETASRLLFLSVHWLKRVRQIELK